MKKPKHTPGPWESAGPHSHGDKGCGVNCPNEWTYKQHKFPEYLYEGALCDEWGVYPPLGESGPVALVAGEANARLIAAAPTMLEALKGEVCSAGCPETCCGKLRAAIKLAEGDQ